MSLFSCFSFWWRIWNRRLKALSAYPPKWKQPACHFEQSRSVFIQVERHICIILTSQFGTKVCQSSNEWELNDSIGRWKLHEKNNDPERQIQSPWYSIMAVKVLIKIRQSCTDQVKESTWYNTLSRNICPHRCNNNCQSVPMLSQKNG